MQKIRLLSISIILVMTIAMAGLAFGVSASPLSIGVAPGLGTAGSFAVLGGSTVTNTGSSVLNGSLGVWPGTAISGFPPGVVTPPGTTHAADAVAQQAQSDVTAAYNALAGQACDSNLSGQDLGGLTLVPGVYCYDAAAQLTGTLTLNSQGNPNAVFVFKIGSALTTATSSSVVMINSGSPCNTFFQIGTSATLGTTTSFQGNILALSSITLNTGANLIGRALARNGAVTLDTNNVTPTFCSAPQETATMTATSGTPATATATATSETMATAAVTATSGTAATAKPPTHTPNPTETKLPPVSGLPGTGGAPIRNENSPWSLVVLAGVSVILLTSGILAYRRSHLPKQ